MKVSKGHIVFIVNSEFKLKISYSNLRISTNFEFKRRILRSNSVLTEKFQQGVILKLGGYSLIRVISVFITMGLFLNPFFLR